MTAYQAAQKIAAALNKRYSTRDATAWTALKVRENGWGGGDAEAQVVLEDSQAYEWAIEFTGGDLGAEMTALYGEIRSAGVFMEPGTSFILNLYSEESVSWRGP